MSGWAVQQVSGTGAPAGVKVPDAAADKASMPVPAPTLVRRPSSRCGPSAVRRRLLGAFLALGCAVPLLGPAGAARAAGPASSRPAAVTVNGADAGSRVPTAADRRIAARLAVRSAVAPFARSFSGTVLDVGSGRVVWSRRAATPRMPASTAKLVTATTALTAYGPAHRFITTVRQGSTSDSIVLVGAGDPSLSTAHLRTLAAGTTSRLRAAGVQGVRLWVDDTLFDRPGPASGWKPSYVPSSVRWVRALVVDGHHVADTSLDAARVFAAQLRAAGIAVVSVGRASAAEDSPVLAAVAGDRLDAIVRQMMLVSDNDHAEALHRLVAVRAGYPATWAGARRAQREVLAQDEIWLPPDALQDGSGLSRRSRVSTDQLAAVVANILGDEQDHQDDLAVLRTGALPVAGRTGTLRPALGRFTTAPSGCARGRLVAKTGTLRDVVALAGWTRGTDGRLKAFAFIVNGSPAGLALKRQVDALAATVTGCY